MDDDSGIEFNESKRKYTTQMCPSLFGERVAQISKKIIIEASIPAKTDLPNRMNTSIVSVVNAR